MAQNNYECILFDVSDGVGRITLNMPQFSNALIVAGIQEFLHALNECEARDDVGAVLTAVNGIAVGVGLGISLCSDIVICHENARFLCAWHSIGLANDATSSYSLTKVVGWRRAFELMMTNRTLNADEAVDWGIANRRYGDADFAKNVDQVARELAAGPTHLQAMARDSFHGGWRRSVEEATEYKIQNVMKSVRHPYFREAVDKFLKGEIKADQEQVRLP